MEDSGGYGVSCGILGSPVGGPSCTKTLLGQFFSLFTIALVDAVFTVQEADVELEYGLVIHKAK